MAKPTAVHNVNGCTHGSKPGATKSWEDTTCGNCLKKRPAEEPVATGITTDPALTVEEPSPALAESFFVAPVAAAQTIEPAYAGPKTKFSGSAADRRRQRRALARQQRLAA